MKKIAVFTGTRAEYGLLFGLLKAIESSNASLSLLVGGMHLSSEYGDTASTIESDGFEITERLDYLLSSSSPVAISKSMALAQIAAAECFSRIKPDILVVLGDRFESLAVAQASMIAQIPIAHIHGGELTQGLIDDPIRHSITKMAQLHFTSTEVYRKRVIQLGEQPSSVFNVGAPGIDNIANLSLLSFEELNITLNNKLSKPYFLVTYHPVTLEKEGGITAMNNMLKALLAFPHQVLLTYPNADTFGKELLTELTDFVKNHPKKFIISESLGQRRYLSALKHTSAVIGNSSSGLIEAPSFNVPTVNIGNRQLGRITGESVINCGESSDAIQQAISQSLSPKFNDKIKKIKNLYGDGKANERILSVLLNYSHSFSTQKTFYDI
ncbi:UDP-N-acetylglucosamine 2-epimerase [Thalassotalea sp. 1_MG-2023]|uniref:UDP-N-acetylglucosamine 2-epimerase n=1 Tax=Thalassotalea sp. 1_MG-2023 TaxID=3062680 RepID=UPI0026E2517E|nr:UDP-N-acetylglucosamine 2-epimerase [Thalassotalea sp. 1_MG-2023]MDO6426453.1 UDP-N-acetylglucosamine 2-epimerase [Thalassotalea sp. 1_MG-2023]